MKRSVLIPFLIAEALLYVSFLFMDIYTVIDTRWLKFASILLIALMSLQASEKSITAALCLTAAGDVFLLVLDRWYTIGVSLFIVVQLLYSLHLNDRLIRSIQIALAITSAFLALITNRIEMLAVGYILLFILNLFQAGYQTVKHKTTQTVRFFFGLLLFFFCDLCVGYYQIGSGQLWSFARIAMWLFYLPGQVLILLSVISNQGEFQ